MRVGINLATQPYEDTRRFWMRWGLAVTALSLITLVLLYSAAISVISARKDRDLIHQREQQIAARDQEKAHAEAELSLPQNRNTRDRSNFLNDAFQQKSFSWTRVFEDLEQVMPPRLHVVSIQPANAEDNQLQIKLVVAGESRERAEDLVRKMEGSRRFQETHIESESAQQATNGNGDNVVFDITANYVPDVPDAKMQGGQ
jgi:type IV pilus assembly protein PilN